GGIGPCFGRHRAIAILHLECEVHPALQVESVLQATVVVVRPRGPGQDQQDHQDSAFQAAEHRASLSQSFLRFAGGPGVGPSLLISLLAARKSTTDWVYLRSVPTKTMRQMRPP